MPQGQQGPKAKPDITFRVGRVRAAVWSNKVTQEDGSTMIRHSVALEKSWKPDPKKEAWEQRAIPLFPDELADVQLVCQMVRQQFCVDVKC